MKEVKDKVVLITGAAMGMGKLLAERFGKDGARLVVVDINENALAQTAKEFKEKGFQVYTYVCDVSKRENIYELAEKVKNEVGTVDVLVNNAGIVHKALLMNQPDEAIEKLMDINVNALFWTTKAFLPGMMEKNSGHIVNVASAAGLLGVPYAVPYCTSKFAVVGMTEAMRYEMKLIKKDIKFTTVCPSYVATGMFAGAKPPKMTSWLSPEKMVDAIYKGIKADKIRVLEPLMAKFSPALKELLPVKAFDNVYRWLGVHKSMEEHTGRVEEQ